MSTQQPQQPKVLLSTLKRGQLFSFTDMNDNRIYEFLSAQAVIKYKQPSSETILACVSDRLVRVYF